MRLDEIKDRHFQSSSLAIQNDQRHHLDRGKGIEVGGGTTIANILGRKGLCVSLGVRVEKEKEYRSE